MKTKLEAPWQTYRKMLNALFQADPDIEVGEVVQDDETNNCDYEIQITVRDSVKYWSLKNTLLERKTFGNVTIHNVIKCASDNSVQCSMNKYKTLFQGNPIVRDFRQAVDPAGEAHGYILFEPEVIQFFHDDISDYSGNWSGLAQDIAREVFYGFPGIHFCTASLREKVKDSGPEDEDLESLPWDD